MLIRRSPNRWFEIWSSIIKNKKDISRVDLADISECSLWTIRALTKDFTDRDAYVTYSNNKFHWITYSIEQTLSTLSNDQLEKLR